MTHRYRAAVLEQLWRHGVQPTDTTPPERVHEFVSDLYRYELRRMRDRLRGGQIRKLEYFDCIVELRRKYPLISIAPAQWLDEPSG